MVGLDQGVKLEESDQEFLSTQTPGIPPLAPHASLGIDDAQAASLALAYRGSVVGLDQGVKSDVSRHRHLASRHLPQSAWVAKLLRLLAYFSKNIHDGLC